MHEELPGRGAVLRFELAHGKVWPERLAIFGERNVELGWDRVLGRSRVCLRWEAPAKDGFRETAEVGQVLDRAFLRVECALLDGIP